MKDEPKKEKSRASMIIDGDIEPEPHERYLLNLRKRKPFNQWDKDRMHEVAVMGGKAVQELHGERRSAKESLENILSLKATDEIIANCDIDKAIAERVKRDNPNATLYDMVQAVAVAKALDGSINAMTYVRDTNGDMPKKEISITDNIMTDKDRELLESIADRLNHAENMVIVETQSENGEQKPRNPHG